MLSVVNFSQIGQCNEVKYCPIVPFLELDSSDIKAGVGLCILGNSVYQGYTLTPNIDNALSKAGNICLVI